MFGGKRLRGEASFQHNPLVPVVRQFDDRTRRALYAASNSTILKRRTWRGCAFNRAAALLGQAVTSKNQAAEVFRLRPALVVEFIDTWDGLRGSDKHCTALLREALLAAGLFGDRDQPAVDEQAPQLTAG